MAQVWDENWFGPTKTLDVTMAGLRRRSPRPPRSPAALAGCLISPRSEGMATASSAAARAMGPGRGVDWPSPVRAGGSALIRPTPSGQRLPYESLRTCPGCRRRPWPNCGPQLVGVCRGSAVVRAASAHRARRPGGRPGAVRSVSPCPSGGR
ncbi:hypothetical protein ACF1A5_27530 [Streptomyces sp. NPDC014864]|uniref:hypothetical protein n=1 Tax=Streptomyces sp. NPDC014864 TaxID=3364924 RepID=UPI0036F8BDDC